MHSHITQVLFAALGLALAGCAGATPATQTAAHEATVRGEASTYSAALEEAFVRYESEIERASKLEYRSQAELEAVIATLSDARFDWGLRQALARRGLSVDDLGAYALANPDFFHAEQRRHWGRLQRAQGSMKRVSITEGPDVVSSMEMEEAAPLETASAR